MSAIDATYSTAVVMPVNRLVLAHRLVQIGLLLTLVWKWSFFQLASRIYADFTLVDPFFPDFFRSVITLRIAYLAAVGSIALNLVTGSRNWQQTCTWITFASLTILCLHQASYNDMTFVTAWWTSLWSVWYVHQLSRTDNEDHLLSRAAFLSRLIISLILLGGAVGKWTGEYWSGEVLHDIYFRDRDYWAFNFLRANFEPETLRVMAKWYSRQVVMIETFAGLGLWALPPKIAAAIAVVLLSSIALSSNFLLFSVLSTLIGLASVGFLVRRPKTNR